MSASKRFDPEIHANTRMPTVPHKARTTGPHQGVGIQSSAMPRSAHAHSARRSCKAGSRVVAHKRFSSRFEEKSVMRSPRSLSALRIALVPATLPQPTGCAVVPACPRERELLYAA